MSISTPITIRANMNGLSSTVSDQLILDMIANAEKKLRKWIGDTLYDWTESIITATSPDPKDLLCATVIRNSEAALTMYYAIGNINVKVSAHGLVMSASSQQFGDATFSVATPQQVQQMKDQYFAMAEELVSDYISSASGVFQAT
jgi:hypothetical protein